MSLSTLEAERKASGRLTQDAAYHIAKAMHHAKACEFYLLQTINEAQATGTAKSFLKELANKAAVIVQRVTGRLRSTETKTELVAEMADPLYMDQMTDAFIALTPENRLLAEDYLGELLAGQKRTDAQKGGTQPCN